MPINSLHLLFACCALVLLVFIVAVAMMFARMGEMRQRRIHPQSASTSAKMATHLENVQAADNFRNLFEVPVLFFALAAVALATGPIPPWLVICAWLFVALRALHSFIHCTYNKVYHRFAAFASSSILVIAMWVAFTLSLLTRATP